MNNEYWPPARNLPENNQGIHHYRTYEQAVMNNEYWPHARNLPENNQGIHHYRLCRAYSVIYLKLHLIIIGFFKANFTLKGVDRHQFVCHG